MINKETIKELPEKSGCYLFYNKDGIVIYVGKAKNLKKRVASYFYNNEEKKRNFKYEIERIQTFITENQKEALILEQNLIKKNQPRYNVLLKDSNNYPYIHITGDKNPRYMICYKIFNRGGEYFGPFPDGSRAKEILNLLERIFPLAKCKPAKKKQPCIYYSIGQCSGCCFKEIREDYYIEVKKGVCDFFNGKTEKIKAKIQNSIESNIKRLSFEMAQKQKKILDSIDFFVSSQNVEFSDRKNRDFLGKFKGKGMLAINILIYRYGKLVTSHEKVFSLEDQLASDQELVQSYIFQFYRNNLSPRILYSKESIMYKNEMEETLNLKNIVPLEDEKIKKVLDMANANAQETWKRNFLNDFKNIKKLDVLKEIGGMLKTKIPYEIEAIDISNIFLQDTVASFSYFKNGEYLKSKLYKLEEPERSDFDYIRNACMIHYAKIPQEKIPDLIVVDGGREQIKSVKKCLENLNLNTEIIGLVKNEKHQTEKIMNKNFEVVGFNKKEIKNFFAKIQEIVHNKAIGLHRKLHIKSTLESKK